MVHGNWFAHIFGIIDKHHHNIELWRQLNAHNVGGYLKIMVVKTLKWFHQASNICLWPNLCFNLFDTNCGTRTFSIKFSWATIERTWNVPFSQWSIVPHALYIGWNVRWKPDIPLTMFAWLLSSNGAQVYNQRLLNSKWNSISIIIIIISIKQLPTTWHA